MYGTSTGDDTINTKFKYFCRRQKCCSGITKGMFKFGCSPHILNYVKSFATGGEFEKWKVLLFSLSDLTKEIMYDLRKNKTMHLELF